jgi:hypothetical protein
VKGVISAVVLIDSAKSDETVSAADPPVTQPISSILDANLRQLNACCNYLCVIEQLCAKLAPVPVLFQQSPLFKCLRRLWLCSVRICTRLGKDASLASSQMHGFGFMVKLLRTLSRIWVHIRVDPSEIDVLFEFIQVFKIKENMEDFSSLMVYVKKSASELPVKPKREIICHFLSNLFTASITLETKLLTVQIIILPILMNAYKEGTADTLLDSGVVKLIVQEIIVNSASDGQKYFDGEVTITRANSAEQHSAKAGAGDGVGTPMVTDDIGPNDSFSSSSAPAISSTNTTSQGGLAQQIAADLLRVELLKVEFYG